MSVRINTNIEALNAQRNLSGTASLFAKSVERLSSGLRINRAADDAAGLAISQKLSAQVTGLNQAERNSQDGISMVQTAEGALTEVHSMLQRIRELAVEASNATLSTTDAASVADEVTSLRAEIDRIAKATTFNGQHLLTGALSVSQTGGTLAANTSLATGHAAMVTSVDVSGGTGSTTYTLSTTSSGKLTLSNSTGVSETVSLSAIGASGTATIDFAHLGVKLAVAGDPLKTAAELATDLATTTGTLVPAIGGVPGSDLANGVVLGSVNGYISSPPDTVITYHGGSGGLDGSYPVTMQPNDTGVPTGTITLSVDGVTGAITGSVGGENFSETLETPVDGMTHDVQLRGDRGDLINLRYKDGTGANWAQEAADLNGAAFTFVAGTDTGTISNMAAAPTATTGTYTFSAPPNSNTGFWSDPATITLTGPGGSQTISIPMIGANGTDTLNFNTLGISFDVHAGPGGLEAGAVVTGLLEPANNTIVVTTSGSAGSPRTIVTGAGNQANFQVGANSGEVLGVSFADVQVAASGYGSWNSDIDAFASATAGGSGIFAAAQALIASTDTAISYISTTRGKLGAVQNRLSHTIASVSVASENLTASLSRIRDLDIASEMVNFTKTQILQQAGTAILAQANSAPQNILSLLR